MGVAEETKQKMQGVVDHFKNELKMLRTNRANPSMIESVMVEVYGSPMRLRDVATITVPESRQLLITPFDPSTASAISKGIEKANLNLQPIVDGHTVRITIPPMDEAMRKEIAKQAKKKSEDAKVALREVRRKQNDAVRKQKTDGDITEDQLKKGEKLIQEATDQAGKEIDQLLAAKEKEVMTI